MAVCAAIIVIQYDNKSKMYEMCRRLMKLSYVVQSDKEGKTRQIGFRDKVCHV